jgi:uncharacterized membrane protein YqjE
MPEVVSRIALGALEQERTTVLLKEAVRSGKELVQQEIALARVELKADLRAELALVKGIGIAGMCALFAVNLLLVAGALALGLIIPEWLAALLVAVALLCLGALAALFGWRKRVAKPLDRTQKTLLEDWRWAKERLA